PPPGPAPGNRPSAAPRRCRASWQPVPELSRSPLPLSPSQHESQAEADDPATQVECDRPGLAARCRRDGSVAEAHDGPECEPQRQRMPLAQRGEPDGQEAQPDIAQTDDVVQLIALRRVDHTEGECCGAGEEEVAQA